MLNLILEISKRQGELLLFVKVYILNGKGLFKHSAELFFEEYIFVYRLVVSVKRQKDERWMDAHIIP